MSSICCVLRVSTPVPANSVPGNKTVVELGDVVRVTKELGSPTIFRRDGRFTDMVMAELAGAYEAPIYGILDVDKRIAGAAAVGAHKTSMLQDLERGRAMEIDPLLTAVGELGVLTGVPTPAIDTVLGLVRLRARVAGLYPWAAAKAPSPDNNRI